MPATCCARSGTTSAGATATSRSRSTRRWRTTREATFDEAMRLHGWIDRPNLFVKIPAHGDRARGDRGLIARGKSINVTLIFSLERYRGRRSRRTSAGSSGSSRPADVPAVASVASFFVSRVDTEADKRLEADRRTAERCRASSRSRTRSSPTSTASRRSRARAGSSSPARARTPQRCLWASTSTKNPDYRDVAVRRGADRAGDGQHDAGARRSRPSRITARSQRHLDQGRRRGARAARRAARGRRRLRRRRRDARGGGRAEVRRLLRRAARRASGRSASSWCRREDRDGRPRPHGRRHDPAARGRTATRCATYDPNVESTARRSPR